MMDKAMIDELILITTELETGTHFIGGKYLKQESRKYVS
jgi:hypothetical protein